MRECDEYFYKVLEDFCDVEINESPNKCCEKQVIINDNGINVCKICGQVSSYDYVNEYIDFHKNKYRIKRKSIYNSTYHVNNF